MIPARAQGSSHQESAQLSERERNWVENQFNLFSDQLRLQSDLSLDAYAQRVIHRISEMVQAVSACFFTLSDDRQALEMKAGYALEERKERVTRFDLDEGPVGRAFQRRRSLRFSELGPEDAQINLGLAAIHAGYLQFTPLVFNHEAFGVLELMFMKAPRPEEEHLIERIAGLLASNLQSQLNTIRTQQLLDELRAREEKLRENNETLRNSQQDMQSQQMQLYVAQQTMRIAQDNAGMGLWEMDTQQNMFTLSSRAQEHLGASQPTVHLKEVLQQLPQESAQGLQAHVETARSEHQSFRMEVRYEPSANNDTGKDRYIVISGSMLFDDDQQPMKLVGATQDISDLRHKQLEAEQSAKNMQMVLDATPVGMLVSHFERGDIVLCNQPVARLLGMSREELLGRTTVSFYKYAEERQKLQEAVRAHGAVDDFRITLETPETSQLEISLSAHMIQYDQEPHFLVTLQKV